jgi:hypothetical protein
MQDLSADAASARRRQDLTARLVQIQRELGDPLVLKT